jgi:hypothetical protein
MSGCRFEEKITGSHMSDAQTRHAYMRETPAAARGLSALNYCAAF